MKTGFQAFNSYLLAAILAPLLLGGCKSAEERARDRELTTLRLHLEANPDPDGRTTAVPIFRERPAPVTVQQMPLTHEGYLDQAWVEDHAGSFVIKLQFESTTGRLLENITATNKGRRIAVFCAFPETRWLAAPVITQPITNGVFAFTPDATREESERIVRGLNNVVAKLKKRSFID